MLNSFRAKTNCEEEAKFIQDRIQSVERHVAELCNVFAQYSRKAARIRDKGDEISRICLNFANAETINKSLAVGLENFADTVSTVSDYGDARVRILDTKIIGEFSKYEDICKKAREEVRDIYSAREKEINRKRQLDRIRERNPRNRHQIVQAETELVKATAEVSKTLHKIEDKTSSFEKQKLHDIKSILLDFISTEMGYHAKALEILTKSFSYINLIDEESDLEDFQNMREKIAGEFKKSMRVAEPHHRQSPEPHKAIFRSGSLGGIFSATKSPKRGPGIPSKDKLKFSKSEETLDSMKHSISNTEESEDSDEENSTVKSNSESEESSLEHERNNKK